MFSPFGLANSTTTHQILGGSTPILVDDADRNVNFLRPVVAPPSNAAFSLPLLTAPIMDSSRRSSVASIVSDSELPFDRSRPLPSSTLNAMKVYMRNIPSCVSEDDVQRFAESYGAVRKVERGRERGGTTHCCYVTFESTVAATECARTANGTAYFVQLAASKGVFGAMPTATVRMAESLEERKERLARKDGGIVGALPPCQSALPPPPPYLHSYIAPSAQPPASIPISTPSITLQHLHPNAQSAPTASPAVSCSTSAPVVYIIIPQQ